MLVVVMGVSGAGKSTIGGALAERIGARFVDADDHHPRENVEKMRRGVPLEDADRLPWLQAVSAHAASLVASGQDVVLACSALKESYRRVLAAASPDVRWVLLEAPEEVLLERLSRRVGHFAGPALLASQLLALEPPEDAVRVDVSAGDPEAVVDEIVAGLARR